MNVSYIYDGRLKVMQNDEYKILPDPAYQRIKNGIVIPCRINNHASGGVCDSDSNYIPESSYEGDWIKRGGGYSFDKEDINLEHCNEKVIFLGYFGKHWGHYIIDYMGRFWVLGLREFDKYKVCYLDDSVGKLDGNYLEFLRLLNVTQERIVHISEPTMFSEVIVPNESKDTTGFSLAYKKVFCDVVKNAEHRKGELISIPSKIYFSRQLFGDAQKKEIGEYDIEKEFKKQGYTVLYPEKLSLIDQIRCFQEAKEIACINGTIPLNSVFANRDLKLIVINKSSLRHHNLLLITKMMEIDPIYIDAYYEPIKGHPRFVGEGPFWIEINDNMVNFFKENDPKTKISKKNRDIKDYILYYKMFLSGRLKNYLRVLYRKMIKAK